jgi:hypothetical protein
MKTVLFIIVLGIFSFFFPFKKNATVTKVNLKSSSKIDTVYFQSKVLPILKKNCSPCHFRGGKMYGRMPFDQPATIISHEAGALKRFKVTEELSIVKNYIELNKQ